VNSTTVTATFTISGGLTTTTGARAVTVTTPNGVTNSMTFTVSNPPVPTLTKITPNSGAHGTNVPVTITGANLTGASVTLVLGPGVTVSNVVVNPAGTSLTATFSITSGALRIPSLVFVTTPGGNSLIPLIFTVN